MCAKDRSRCRVGDGGPVFWKGVMKNEEPLEASIAKVTRTADKTYGFDDAHDSAWPAQVWFQDAAEGLVLFVVFYTQACRWSRCLGCNLPSLMSEHHVPFDKVMLQVDHLLARMDVVARAGEVRKVIVSNNGSVLDEATFSSTALIYLIAKAKLHFPNLRVLSMETRPEFVDLAELEFMKRTLGEGAIPTQLELAIGFEAFDERIRNDVFNKGLSLAVFEKLVAEMAPYGFGLKCYFMQKPVPGMTDAEAVEDVCAGLRYLAGLSSRHGVRISMHLNPTYAATGTRLAAEFSAGRYEPPRLADVARAVLAAEGSGVTVFVGLSDEGLAVPGGSFVRAGDERLLAALADYNRTQDFAALKLVAKARE
jgi:radical SAM enzyme (TIGR01210 family)